MAHIQQLLPEAHWGHYPAEAVAASTDRPVLSRSQIAKLTPFRDENSLLRVGGCLKHALLSIDERHPLIIPLQLAHSS